MTRWILVIAGALVCAAPLLAQSPAVGHALGTKYTRDSEEYAALARQTYRVAADAVRRSAQGLPRERWTVVVDIDETALDNSVYELERASYGLPFDPVSWNAWVFRHAAGVVPGAADFVAAVREIGGRITWISNRDTVTRDATRVNLRGAGLWNDDDRLCTQDRPDHSKRARRAEVVSGTGACAWAGVPMRVVAFVGDQMGDFPAEGESFQDAGADAAFGRTCFLLPNAMYGDWTVRVTRKADR